MALTNLKFTFGKLGPVDEAKLELGDLTIIAGRNNTGKTYIVNTLYGFLKHVRNYLEIYADSDLSEEFFMEVSSRSVDELVSELIHRGYVSWDISEERLNQVRSTLVQEAAGIYSRLGIGSSFTDPEGHFEDSYFEVEIDIDPFDVIETRFMISTESFVSIKRDGTRFVATLTLGKSEAVATEGVEDSALKDTDEFYHNEIRYILKRLYFLRLVNDQIGGSDEKHILNSHRLTIPLLFKEIDQSRNYIVHYLQQALRDSKFDSNPLDRFLNRTSRYPLPVMDNIDLARQLPELIRGAPLGRYLSTLNELTEMIGGEFKSVRDDIRFVSKESDKAGARHFDIPLDLTSSSVQQMPLLYGILGYLEIDLLIIDEPESHLDTANQIQLTRILSRLVNSGVKVLITTHSDYIVKEFNNLIMLSSPLEDGDKIKFELGYRGDEQLRPDQVKAYVAENGGLTPCKKDRFGLEVTSLDETIDDLNRTSEELASQIMMKEME